MVTHFLLQKNMSLICNTKKHSNNRKRHTNRHLQGRLWNLFQILTSDVVTTTRLCTESCHLTNNNKTPGSDIFCKERFFALDFSYSNHRQTVVLFCFRHKVLLLSSCRLLVLNPPPQSALVWVLSQVWNVFMLLSSMLCAHCRWPLDPVSLNVITN